MTTVNENYQYMINSEPPDYFENAEAIKWAWF